MTVPAARARVEVLQDARGAYGLGSRDGDQRLQCMMMVVLVMAT